MCKNKKFIKLFTDYDEHYTQIGLDFANEIQLAIQPILDRYEKLGCSLRELDMIASCEVNTSILIMLLERQSRRD